MADSNTRRATIAGHIFTIAAPYSEGHTINAAEAKALNQTRAEGVANNLRAKIKEIAEAEGASDDDGNLSADAQKAAADLVTEYDSNYEITLSSSGGGRTAMDPVEKEAHRLAREAVSAAAKSVGKKIKDLDQDKLRERIAEIAARPEVVKKAKLIVDARQKMPTLEDLGVPESESEPATTAE